MHILQNDDKLVRNYSAILRLAVAGQWKIKGVVCLGEGAWLGHKEGGGETHQKQQKYGGCPPRSQDSSGK
jgi:hypothetical protein